MLFVSSSFVLLQNVSNSNGVNSNDDQDLKKHQHDFVSNSNGVNSNLVLLILIILVFIRFKLQRSKF